MLPALPWILADGGIEAGAPAEQLVQSVCPQDLEMQRLLKLAQLRGGEEDLQFHLAVGRHYPAALAQPGIKEEASVEVFKARLDRPWSKQPGWSVLVEDVSACGRGLELAEL